MKILLYGINYWPELTGVGKYTGELSEWLSHQEHEVHVITAPPYYPEWEVRDGYSAFFYHKELHGGVEVYRTPIFVPKKPTTMSRILHLISFSISSFPLVISHIFWKPDIVFFVQPTLFSSVGALILARLSGAKSIMHVQDYEIDAMLGLGMGEQGLIIKWVTKLEYWLMSKFDVISTISYSMMEKAKQKGVPESKLIFFPNWADTEFVAPISSASTLKAEWGFSDRDTVILYAGNIGKKQGLELVLDAAEKLKGRENVRFVIVGTGAHVGVLNAIAVEKRLSNVYFKPLQPWARVPEMLAMADIHLVIQKRGAADVVLPSKLTNILSIGGYSLVTAEKYTELGLLSEKYPGIYQRVEPENVALFVEALHEMLEKRSQGINNVAREYALKFLSKNIVLSDFEVHLNKMYKP